MKEKILEALKKRALGFCYEEEVREYEEVKGNNKPLFCEKRKRFYLKNGFLKVKLDKKGWKITKFIKKFAKFEKSCHYFLKNEKSGVIMDSVR